jgi:aminoglycoside 6'-N-acetyltransferase I
LSADAVSIRRALPGDAEQLIEVAVAARGTSRSDPRIAIEDPDRLVVVAELDDTVVGWAKTHHYRRADGAAAAGHYLGGVNVLPDFQRRGIGSALVRARLGWIFGRSTEAWYFTNARNSASIALHAGFGFTEVGRANALHGTTFEGGVGILFRSSSGQNLLDGPSPGDNF